MATIRRIEDLDAWTKARRLVSEIYAITRNPPVKTDLGYCDQIQRAAMSAMSNIAEGFERHSDKEFAQFLNVSIASASEVSSMLHAGLDVGHLTRDQFDRLSMLCRDTILTSSKLQACLRRSARAAKSIRSK